MCGDLRGEAVGGSQNPHIWVGNDGVPKASYEVTARTVKFLGKLARFCGQLHSVSVRGRL